jgi:hypothetical protein
MASGSTIGAKTMAKGRSADPGVESTAVVVVVALVVGVLVATVSVVVGAAASSPQAATSRASVASAVAMGRCRMTLLLVEV